MINPEDMNVEGMERDMNLASHKAYMESCKRATQKAIEKTRERSKLEAQLMYEAHCHDVEKIEITKAREKAIKEMILNRADFEDYMPPIVTMVNQFTDALVEYREGKIMAAINETVHVDKDELLKALEYDRGQFEAGYKSAMKKVTACIDDMYDRGELGHTQYMTILQKLSGKKEIDES